MVSKLEFFNQASDLWVPKVEIAPGVSAFLPSTEPDGRRLIYVFSCSSDDSHTHLFKTKPETTMMLEGREYEIKNSDLISVAALKRGDKPFRWVVGGANGGRIVRISHV